MRQARLERQRDDPYYLQEASLHRKGTMDTDIDSIPIVRLDIPMTGAGQSLV